MTTTYFKKKSKYIEELLNGKAVKQALAALAVYGKYGSTNSAVSGTSYWGNNYQLDHRSWDSLEFLMLAWPRNNAVYQSEPGAWNSCS